MPSVSWFANFLQAMAKESNEKEATVIANDALVTPRDFGRYTLLDVKGKEITLSLAVEGGGRQLRHPDRISDLRLSEHGSWRRNHLKALEACLGKKPYFPYYRKVCKKIRRLIQV